MRDGDISNAVQPRLWFQFEGLIAVPNDPLANIEAYTHCAAMKRRLRISREFWVNQFVSKRMWDLSRGRHDFRLAVATYESSHAWLGEVETLIDLLDLPASLQAFDSREAFYDEVVLSPGCARVYTPEPRLALAWGGKAQFVDPSFDFEPLPM